MPTLPTSFPRRFKEVRFPYEFMELYSEPLKYFGGSSSGGAAPSSAGNPFGGETVNTLWHDKKAAATDFMALSGVQENHKKDKQMITGQRNRQIHSILQSGMRGGCHDCSKHDDIMRGGLMNMMSPSTIEGANVLAGRGLRGGVMKTQAGHQYLLQRLTARIAELDTTDVDVNGVGSTNPNGDTEPSPDDEIIMDLGEYLDNIIESVSTGNIESSNVKDARGFLKSLLEGGWQIPSNQLVMLQRNLDDTVRELQGALSNKASTYALSSDRKKVTRTVLTTLERARSVVEELVKKSDLSPKERKMVVSALRPKLRQQLAAQLESQVPGRLRRVPRDGEEMNPADYMAEPDFERTYGVPARPGWYTKLAAIPGKRVLPRSVAERIAARG
jgi:polyhydroxyalkanoate synthesis regulator phasin